MAESIQKLPQVMARVGMGRSTLLQRVKDGKFPRPVKTSERAVGWVSSDIDAWIASRVADRDAAVA